MFPWIINRHPSLPNQTCFAFSPPSSPPLNHLALSPSLWQLMWRIALVPSWLRVTSIWRGVDFVVPMFMMSVVGRLFQGAFTQAPSISSPSPMGLVSMTHAHSSGLDVISM